MDFIYDMMAIAYPWVKSLHLVSVISWMAGLLYLPRLFVYHVETDPNHINLDETIVRWEELLMRRIMGPAMGMTWLCGIILILTPGIIYFGEGWIWVKLICIFFMSWFHMFLSRQIKLLAAGERPYTGKQYRMLNEVPTVLMIIIVIMVIVRPF